MSVFCKGCGYQGDGFEFTYLLTDEESASIKLETGRQFRYTLQCPKCHSRNAARQSSSALKEFALKEDGKKNEC